MFTFVNYTIITCYVACVGYCEPRLCLPVKKNKGSSKQSPSTEEQHGHPLPFQSASLEAIPSSLWRLPVIAGNVHAGGAGASGKQQRGLCVWKELDIPGGPRWETTLLGVDLGHGLAKVSGPTFRLGNGEKVFK